ncbi:vWA domain-containing protein [Aquimarina brevivitae]|uniref:Putative membrane protein (TIGR02226 family) n=1 Tax=Aquimarina brevivitae TaxID=323412 RepID=A0A4Q7P1C8_9FLAO|nr:BatA and WFA domain-containing protein [Aquimarina brevivitae]RZS93643.1 putative membrane protein (TIGR02226 family) [Aquimarina brevivitae]
MQFKHPELLYALFALLIPILVHLFQLRRFQKVAFTNVQFLKKVVLQTRKSSQLKKWLTLITRLLALAAIIIAFAQPFTANTTVIGKKTKTVIYLDNSFSMEARGPKGALLKRAVQELLSDIPEDQQFSLFTNTETYNAITKKDIQNDLLQLDYSSYQMPYSAAYLKASQMLGKTQETINRIILISDFQQKGQPFDLTNSNDSTISLVQLTPISNTNVAIDSLYLDRDEKNDLLLQVRLRSTGKDADNISLSFYNDQILLGKTAVNIKKNSTANATFKLNENSLTQGRVIINEPALNFDNKRYFTLNQPEKIKVITINEGDDKYLQNIYTSDEFKYTSYDLTNVNYNDFESANLIVLNELKEIPVSLTNSLKSFVDKGGFVVFVPAVNGTISSYNQFFTLTGNTRFYQKLIQEKKITTIQFSHPIYNGVFDKEVSNFQYPKVNSFYATQSSNAVLLYEDDSPFLFKQNNVLVFTASLSKGNSNFKNSPLIVPTLYKIGKLSLKVPEISYTIGKTNVFEVPISLSQDGVLRLESKDESIIPLQQSLPTKVRLTTDDVPTKAGIYAIMNDGKPIQYLGYNYDSSESNLQYHSLTTNATYQVYDSVSDLFEEIKEDATINELWKWFVIFALVFLLIEILLLKYLK